MAPGAPAAGIVVPPLDAGRGNAFLGISTRLGSVIDLLVKNGDARLLAEPKLTCRSGGEAEFLAGGEIPLPITGDDGEVSVEFKDYGVILRMQPTIDAAGYIDTDVEVEVSAIDPSVTVQSIPGFLTRRTHTDMNLRQGQTLVISGLLSSRSSGDLEKVPGLGDLPILGELFRSRAFRSDETELVVFVTPHLIDPDTPVNHALMERARTLVDAARRVDDEQQAPATAPATEPGEQWPHE